jgi:hypothetical protein
MSSRFPEDRDDDRLSRLEKEVERLSAQLSRSNRAARFLTWLIFGGLVLGAAGLVTLHETGLLQLDSLTGGVSRTVESREFGFYNQFGTRVLLLDKDKFGYPNLVFMDLQKKYRMGIKVWPDGGGTPGLVFYDDSGLRGHLRMDESKASVFKLTGARQKGSITLSVTEEGDPSVIVTDKTGKVLFAIPEGATEPRPSEPQRPGIMPGSRDPRQAQAG